MTYTKSIRTTTTDTEDKTIMSTSVLIKENKNKEDEIDFVIIKPNPADVLCQRGGKGSVGHDHIGNKRYRSLVLMHKVLSCLKRRRSENIY